MRLGGYIGIIYIVSGIIKIVNSNKLLKSGLELKNKSKESALNTEPSENQKEIPDAEYIKAIKAMIKKNKKRLFIWTILLVVFFVSSCFAIDFELSTHHYQSPYYTNFYVKRLISDLSEVLVGGSIISFIAVIIYIGGTINLKGKLHKEKDNKDDNKNGNKEANPFNSYEEIKETANMEISKGVFNIILGFVLFTLNGLALIIVH